MKIASVAVGNRRLLKLAAFLRTLPRRRFDYTNWVGIDWKGAKDFSCGTTACALGWATTMPAFQRLGLRMGRRDQWPKLYRNGNLDTITDRLFGAGTKELFIPRTLAEHDATAKHVAKKIERFVASRKVA